MVGDPQGHERNGAAAETAVAVSQAEHLASAAEMRAMIFGRLLSAALCTAAALRLPDLLHEGPQTAEQLARRCGALPGPLARLLRVLANFDTVTVGADGAFALTSLGETLRSDVPGSAWPTAMLAAEFGPGWDRLLDTVRTGTPSFERVHGVDVFGLLAGDPELSSLFYASQAADLDLTLDRLSRVDFTRFPTIVDVGGGDGALLRRVLTDHPAGRGVLLDLPGAAAQARERLAAAGLGDRCAVSAGDFFTAVPAGGDLYLLRDILHDWPDARCLELLTVCRRAMAPTATLMIIERVSDPVLSSDPAARLTGLMDLYMLSVLDGRERTLEEFAVLLTSAGFVPSPAVRLTGGAAVIEAAPGPSE
ncbi:MULTISPECIES: methyltransferase [Actinoalloteichus]|uniref:O-methyltransferase n=1 Tax=Actinoalloteichus fjordicus TaxID=1612552 RepID=A0AAC9LDL7_9PSEU|nr:MULTISPECIES: methyltransferase [Actinoalloteichus]APU15401.1 O-methyltransferase [Actinoalloteichus fjordicus]APU21468.1 O-methyltransferase [Actinoalloteichus sp. GBA129-24]